MYLKRFQYLRQQGLDKLNIKILKILREVNSNNNLQIVQSNVFENAKKIQDIDIKKFMFGLPSEENRKTLNVLMSVMAERNNSIVYANLMNSLFYEYFENRKYLLE